MTDLTDAQWAKLYRRFPLAKAFDDAENEFGDHKSTEFLATIAADRSGCEYNDVIAELFAFSQGHDAIILQNEGGSDCFGIRRTAN